MNCIRDKKDRLTKDISDLSIQENSLRLNTEHPETAEKLLNDREAMLEFHLSERGVNSSTNRKISIGGPTYNMISRFKGYESYLRVASSPLVKEILEEYNKRRKIKLKEIEEKK